MTLDPLPSLTLGLILGWAVATPVCVLLILYLQGGARHGQSRH